MKHLIIAMVAVCAMFSCTKREKENDTSTAIPNNVFKQVDVLKHPLQVPNTTVTLPKGTKIFMDHSGSEIRVELPEGYSFFTGSKGSFGNVSLKTLPVIIIGSYTCKCGGQDGRCSVFYLSVGGFGCLHNSCTGTCSGHFVTIDDKKIEGVLNMENSKVQSSLRTIINKASLSATGKEHFFSSPIVQNAILEQHRALFKGFAIPDFNKLQSDKGQQKEYVYIKSYLYGVTYYLIAPRMAVVNYPEGEQIDIEANKCTCPGNGGCYIKKKSLLGVITVHWCEGDCDACVMSV